MADIDPKFETRAELVAWAQVLARYREPGRKEMLATLETIRRVTLAHSHLIGDT